MAPHPHGPEWLTQQKILGFVVKVLTWCNIDYENNCPFRHVRGDDALWNTQRNIINRLQSSQYGSVQVPYDILLLMYMPHNRVKQMCRCHMDTQYVILIKYRLVVHPMIEPSPPPPPTISYTRECNFVAHYIMNHSFESNAASWMTLRRLCSYCGCILLHTLLIHFHIYHSNRTTHQLVDKSLQSIESPK